jgi:HSP20 family molecular chaperone IbpA
MAMQSKQAVSKSSSRTKVLSSNYPYNLKKNIESDELVFEITLAGFDKTDITV